MRKMKSLHVIGLQVLFHSSLFGQSLMGVESVEYDPVNNRYLASSDNSSIISIDPNGALSYFGSGTTADYGMEVMNGVLYAIAGNSIKGYDLTTENQVVSLTISGAQFLNGMGSNGTDRLWVSDFNGYDIYEIDLTNPSVPTYQMVADQTDLGTSSKPNGIVYDADNNRILIAGWGSNAPIRAMDISTYSVTNVVSSTGLGNIDGIDRDAQGNWFISSWTPARITKYSNDFLSSEIITVPGISNPADICYAPETDTLDIPGANQVLFVGFENPSVGIEDENFDLYRIRYHSGSPVVQFELMKAQHVEMEVVDMNGRVVFSILDGMQPEGQHTVVLSSIGLYSGSYICRMRCSELKFSERIFIP